MTHLTEDELIAYALGESANRERTREIARHLEACELCAGDAEQIARTLRVFSAAPVPVPNMDHAWQRLRVNLVNLPQPQPARSRWNAFRPALRWLALAAVLLVAGLTLRTFTLSRGLGHLPPGPISEQPRSAALDAQASGVSAHLAEPLTEPLAAHLEDAERLLTTVSHEPGSLDGATRAQAQHLLLQNAVYVRQARASGDLPEASVLEDLGRTLTTLNHEAEADKRWHLRMELNADGLLLDIRILQQNGSQPERSDTPR